MGEFTKDQLLRVVATYEASKDAARQARDESIRRFAEDGAWQSTELARATGYSRETIRQILSPQVRAEINEARREVTALRQRDGLRPYVVATHLGQLRGPTTGTVTLPGRLRGGGDSDYDLDWIPDLTGLYRDVLVEAASTDDLCTWLDGDLLVRAWPQLDLPTRLRRLWDRRFPALSCRRDFDSFPERYFRRPRRGGDAQHA